MPYVNKVTLIGNAGKDCEMVSTGGKIAKFSLATSESYTGKDGQKVVNTDWHTITCFGPLANIVLQYVKKGMTVYVEGKIKYSKYESKGVEKTTTEIVAMSVLVLDKKAPPLMVQKAVQEYGAASVDDDDIPF